MLTANGKCSLRKRKNLPQPIQLQLSKKQRMFSQFPTAYLKSTSKFEYFEKQENRHRLCIFEIRDFKICGYLNV